MSLRTSNPPLLSTPHPFRRYLAPHLTLPPLFDGGRVKEHPFGVCDACRWSCRGKSRVVALNCTAAASNACRPPNATPLPLCPPRPSPDKMFSRPTPIRPMMLSYTDDNGNVFSSMQRPAGCNDTPNERERNRVPVRVSVRAGERDREER